MKLLGDPTTQHSRPVRPVRPVSSPPESACSQLGRCDVYATCDSELQIFFGWLRVDSGHVSKSIRSMDVYGCFIGIVWHLKWFSGVIAAHHSPPTEQSIHVVEESAEQTTKDANEGKYKHLHNVIPCLLCGQKKPRTKSRILEVTNWLGKKGILWSNS